MKIKVNCEVAVKKEVEIEINDKYKNMIEQANESQENIHDIDFDLSEEMIGEIEDKVWEKNGEYSICKIFSENDKLILDYEEWYGDF